MTTEELTMLLARITVLDNRQVDELTIEAWQDVIGDLDYGKCVAAVNRHFRESTEYLKPAHIVYLVRQAVLSEQEEQDRVYKTVERLISKDEWTVQNWIKHDEEFLAVARDYKRWIDEGQPADNYGWPARMHQLRELAVARRDEAQETGAAYYFTPREQQLSR